jgi:DNA-binding HxlR family transcriptional regulator
MTGMSSTALSRHLEKLVRRQFVEKRAQTYRYGKPTSLLGRTLIKLAGNQSDRSGK